MTKPCAPIDPLTAEHLLHDLVAIPSPSHDETEAVNFLVNWMAAHHFDNAYVDEAGSAVGIKGSGQRDIVLLGHIDTFGGNPPVYLEGRRLYGRGTVDAKGPLCTFAAAAAQAQLDPSIRLIVVGAVQEEASSSKGAHYVAQCYKPEACIIGEPSQWDRITIGYKGRLILRWRWEGGLAHSANRVPTAAEHAVAFWHRVEQYTKNHNGDETRLFYTLDATLQDLNTGQHGAYGWAEMTIGFRLPPELDPETIIQDLTPSGDSVVEPSGMETACVADKDSTLSRTLRAAIREADGQPRFVHKTGTSDMNVVARYWNCPMVAYGPGDSSLDHTPDEHIDLDEYLRAINVLTHALNHLK